MIFEEVPKLAPSLKPLAEQKSWRSLVLDNKAYQKFYRNFGQLFTKFNEFYKCCKH